jgi:hypothetical protein
VLGSEHSQSQLILKEPAALTPDKINEREEEEEEEVEEDDEILIFMSIEDAKQQNIISANQYRILSQMKIFEVRKASCFLIAFMKPPRLIFLRLKVNPKALPPCIVEAPSIYSSFRR